MGSLDLVRAIWADPKRIRAAGPASRSPFGLVRLPSLPNAAAYTVEKVQSNIKCRLVGPFCPQIQSVLSGVGAIVVPKCAPPAHKTLSFSVVQTALGLERCASKFRVPFPRKLIG